MALQYDFLFSVSLVSEHFTIEEEEEKRDGGEEEKVQCLSHVARYQMSDY